MPLYKLSSFNIIFWMTTLCPNLCQALQGQEQQYDPRSQIQSSPSKWEGITGKTRSQTHKTTDYKRQSYKTSDLLLKKKKGHRLGALIVDLARLWLFSFVLCIYSIYTWLCLMKQGLFHVLGERWKGPDKSLDCEQRKTLGKILDLPFPSTGPLPPVISSIMRCLTSSSDKLIYPSRPKGFPCHCSFPYVYGKKLFIILSVFP